jgi:hypothetical protein
MYDYCSNCSEMLLDGYYRYTDSHSTPSDDTNYHHRCCSDIQRENRPLCDDCQNYGKCDACHQNICVFCVNESSQFQCCGLKLCGAGCRTDQLGGGGGTRCPHSHRILDTELETQFMTENDDPMRNSSPLMNCEEPHSVAQLPCGLNHFGCNFYPGHCRTCDELSQDCTEYNKRQRDISLLKSVVDKLESETIRASMTEIMGDPENVKRKQMENRIVGLERSLKRARQTPGFETGAKETMEQLITP